MNKTYYYARVSSKGQSLERQIEKFKELGADERDIITEKKSGKNIDDREAYKALRNQLLRNGDTLIVCSLDRLGRNKADIKAELEHYNKNNIRVKILDIPTTLIDFPQGQEWVKDMVNNILLEVLGSIAEHERLTIRQRQAEGIAVAKKKGIKLGRPSAVKPPIYAEVMKQWREKQITAVKAIELLGTNRNTFYKWATEDRES